MQINKNTPMQYTAVLRASPTLSLGSHSTNIELRLCEDDPFTCKIPLPGSPWIIPYTANVLSKAEGAKRVRLNPDVLNHTAYASEPSTIHINGIADNNLYGVINYHVAAFEKNGHLLGNATVTEAGPQFHISFELAPNLAIGNATSEIEIRLCQDDPVICKSPIAGSPFTVPFNLKIANATNLSKLSPVVGLDTWTSYLGNASHNAYVNASFDTSKFLRRWSLSKGYSMYDAINAVSLENGILYAVRANNTMPSYELVAKDENTGADIWVQNLGSLYTPRPPVIANGNIYVIRDQFGTIDLLQFDQLTGNLKKQTALAPFKGTNDYTTVFANNVYILIV